MKFSARTQMIAALAVSAVLVGSTAAWGSQAYVQSAESAQAQIEEKIAAGNEQIQALTERSSDLEIAIENASTIVNDSNGKVLDNASRQQLEKEIAQAKKTLAEQKRKLAILKKALSTTSESTLWEDLLPTLKQDRVETLLAFDKKQVAALADTVVALGNGIQQVQTAQAAWQAEQDRIAVEQAAAEAAAAAKVAAAARRAAAAQTIQASGGETAPTAPQAPVTAAAAAPVSNSFDAAAYVVALAPNARVVWDDGVCERVLRQVVYLCGFALTNQNGTNTDPVYIYLDGLLRDRYANSVGISVLVHEAAHAKQFFKYGPAMLPNPTSAPMSLGGRLPIEWMADCATIAKLNYGTGSYVKYWDGERCTPEQMAEAATLW